MRPTKEIADCLFGQYWLNVHPISRTVHKPSLEQMYSQVYGEQRSTQPPNSAYALVFTSLFAGLVSMDQEAYIKNFSDSGMTKETFEDNMQQFAEATLGTCSLAHTKNFRALQALVVYLVSVHDVSNISAKIPLPLRALAMSRGDRIMQHRAHSKLVSFVYIYNDTDCV